MKRIHKPMRKKSLGLLRPTSKTKPKSPDLIGHMTIQSHTLKEMVDQIKMADTNEIECNIAGWVYGHGDDKFISVELSPKLVAKKHPGDSGKIPFWAYPDDE
jgi:hypothetical protein